MNVVNSAIRAQAANKEARANALVGYTEILAVNKVHAGIAKGLLGTPEPLPINKFAKKILSIAKDGDVQDRKNEKAIKTLATAAAKVGVRRLILSTVFKAAHGVLRMLMLGARLVGTLLRSSTRLLLRGIFSLSRFLARGLLFTLPRLLLLNPWGLAATAVVAAGVVGYNVYKQAKEQDVFESKETGVVPTTSATSEVALSPKQQLVRGLRNNNPGNLVYSYQTGASREILPNGQPGRFARFNTQAEGIYALTAQLQRDIGGRNRNAPGVRNTIISLVSKYAPQSDNNNVQRYTAFLSKATGLNPYDVINPKDTTLMTNLVIGIITKENGSNPYSRAQIQEAVSRSVAYADRGFRHFEINIKAHTEEVENKTRKAIPLPSSKEASSKAEKAKPSALPEKVLPKADKAKGSGPLGVQVPGVDDVATGFIIPMSGRFSSGSSDKRTVTLQDGRTKTSGHRGIDIAAPSGTPVYAAHSGKVIRASNTDPKGYGNNVVIQGDDRYYSWYAHLSAFRTKVGERLLRGSLLGLSGGAKGDPGAGGSTGPHLHFAISKAFNGKDSGFIPPEQFLVGLPKESERRDLESKGISVIVLSSADSVRPNTEAQYLRQGTKVKVLRI